MKKVFLICVVAFGCVCCVVEIAPENLNFEDLLVVDAKITDQFEQQQIKLSRTIPLNQDSVENETGADVFVQIDESQIIRFSEVNPGHYISEIPFAGQLNSAYRLTINLENGESYQSQDEEMLPSPPVENLYGEFDPFSSSNQEGSGTFRFFFDTQGNESARYYLIEWSETYLVKVPLPSTFVWRGGAIIEERGPFEQVEFCYVSERSNSIITLESVLESGRITRFPIRSFDSFTQALANRYSLEITYYTLSREAFVFWQQVSTTQENDSFFQIEQPGTVPGNIVSNTGIHALGRFDVLSLQTRRVFFEPDDFSQSGYAVISNDIINCESTEEFRTEVGEVEDFITNNPNLDIWFVESGLNDDNDMDFTPMVVYIAKQCTNCTFYGSDVRPQFWID